MLVIKSPLIQELLTKNRVETSQKIIVRVLRLRFGSVPEELATALEPVQGEAQLDGLLDAAVACPDLEAFRARLQAATRPRRSKGQRKRKT